MEMTPKNHKENLSKGRVQKCRTGQPAGTEVAFTERFYSKETQPETEEPTLGKEGGSCRSLNTCPMEKVSF